MRTGKEAIKAANKQVNEYEVAELEELKDLMAENQDL